MTKIVIPVEDRVLVKLKIEEEKTKSGLFIPDVSREKTQIGIVERIGSGEEISKLNLQPEMEIIISKFSGTGIKINSFEDAEYLIVRYEDIIGVIQEQN